MCLLQPMGLQRVGQDLATEQQQDFYSDVTVLAVRDTATTTKVQVFLNVKEARARLVHFFRGCSWERKCEAQL